MRKAIEEVMQKTMGYRKAAAAFKVPQSTPEIKVALFRQNSHHQLKVSLGLLQPVFTLREEEELIGYLKEIEGVLFGLSTADLRKLSFQLVVKNDQKNTVI
ncbi:hypothetical protein PR048_023470 [Dryococelus australis]|uniref:HTH psq-type domain-containing protein n=1 Tax=Dryococelus australis TaxID=614101 RepID=A0ABQ9GUB6_9NEOP|nr:hypothetical protein PR048_023470 [Dryococelus australis]